MGGRYVSPSAKEGGWQVCGGRHAQPLVEDGVGNKGPSPRHAYKIV